MLKMKKTVILFPLLLLLSVSPAPAQTHHSAKTRRQLLRENQLLMTELDSLKQQLEEYRNRFRITDSIAGEMIDIFEENEARTGVGLTPDEYTPEVTDSLLNLWYLHRQVRSSSEGMEYDMDSVHFRSDVPDSVFIQRLVKMNSFITLPYNETVRNYIILYSEKMPRKVAQMISLSDYYFPIFEEVLNKYELPDELKYMAVIESALNPTAVSRAGAKGMWQFMFNTARSYGLRINSYVDERLDPYKSADAAARYLKDAYSIFGDWSLAISAYNCGAGNVNKAIRKAGSNKNFWSIYEFLPRETRGYVPAFVGAMYAFRYAKEHGIQPEQASLPAHIDTFEIHRNLHFQQINELAKVPMETLVELNPQYIRSIVPGNEDTYILRLPYQYAGSFLDNEDSLYTYKAAELFNPATLENIKSAGTPDTEQRIVYKVKKGDTLGKIAGRYHVTVSQLKNWNHLRSTTLRIGQRIIIYKRGAPARTAAATPSAAPSGTSAAPSTAASSASSSAAQQPKPVVYTVRSGDTLYKIAGRYPGVSANDIMRYNGLSSSKIRPGMKLKIPQKP